MATWKMDGGAPIITMDAGAPTATIDGFLDDGEGPQRRRGRVAKRYVYESSLPRRVTGHELDGFKRFIEQLSVNKK